MKAWTITKRILNTPRLFEICMEADTPTELKDAIGINCDDLSEDIFWNLRDYLAFQEH